MKKTFRLENLECAHCAALMETQIRKIEGVHSASVVFMTQKLILDADDDRFGEVLSKAQEVCRRIEPDCEISA